MDSLRAESTLYCVVSCGVVIRVYVGNGQLGRLSPRDTIRIFPMEPGVVEGQERALFFVVIIKGVITSRADTYQMLTSLNVTRKPQSLSSLARMRVGLPSDTLRFSPRNVRYQSRKPAGPGTPARL